MARHTIEISNKIIEPPFIILKPEYTEKEFFEFANEDISCELIEGMLIIHSSASLEHERMFRFLLFLFDRFLKFTNQGEVIGSRFVMRLASDLIFEPDLLILLPESFSKLQPTYLDGPADMIVEILSPATKETDLSKKIPHCLESGAKEVWAINPITQELTVFLPESEAQNYQKNCIVNSITLKNFWINLEWIWNLEKFDPVECLNKIIKKRSASFIC